jgi:hypothetical protein
MLRPGLHLSNAIGVTDADIDICRRWSPMSLLEAMDNIIEGDLQRFLEAWRAGREPEVVLRSWYEPRPGSPQRYELHARKSVALARICLQAGIPQAKILLKPFNEPNMPEWAQWEGFGDKPSQIEEYGRALNTFIDVAHSELPEVRIGGPHCTVGNRDVKFSSDPPGYYYYHGPDMQFSSSPCAEALTRLDVHFVHCYALNPGEYSNRAHGLRFLEYEKYLPGKPVYNVESGCAINSKWLWHENITRGEETVAYLKLMGDQYPQVKGIAFFIGGDRQWDAFRHSDDWSPQSHRPVVYKVENACHEEPPMPPTPPDPVDDYTLLKGLRHAGIDDLVDLRNQIDSFCDVRILQMTGREAHDWDTIAIHHGGDERYQDPLRIARYHVLEKEPPRDATVPYDFMVGQEGRCYFTGRLMWKKKHTHDAKFNRRSVAICALGDYTKTDPAAAQILTMRRLVFALQEFQGGTWGKCRVLYMVPHNWISSTACPGRVEQALIKTGDWPVPPFLGSFTPGV